MIDLGEVLSIAGSMVTWWLGVVLGLVGIAITVVLAGSLIAAVNAVARRLT